MNRRFLFVAVICLNIFSTAKANDEKYCSINVPEKPDKTIRLPYPLSFFISPNPNGEEVAVITEFQNRLVNLSKMPDGGEIEEDRTDTELPGNVDPVFTPDGKYITLPSSYFYRYQEAKRKGDSARPVVAGNYGAPYQSVGQPNPNKEEYNYISDPNPIDPASDNTNIFFTQVSIKEQKVFGIFKRKKKTVKTGHLCKDKITGSLPMISPDGKYISYLDQGTQTTKIMRIGKDGKDCTEMVDLGIPTGKVSFNFDEKNRQLAFHVERSNYMSGWFETIDESFSTDSFIMDIDTEKTGTEDEKWSISGIKRLSHTSMPGTGTYYPRFTRNGGIIAAKTTIDDDGDRHSNIVQYGAGQVINIQASRDSIIREADVQGDKVCEGAPALLNQIALGRLFSSVCDSLKIPDQEKDSILISPFIDEKSCQNLVRDFWNKAWINNNKNLSPVDENGSPYFDQIKQEDLLAICPKQTGTQISKKKKPDIKIKEKKRTDEELFRDKCASCHEAGFSEVKGGLAFFHQNADGTLVENPENTQGHIGLNSYSAEMSILSLISKPEDVRNVMPPEETIISKTERKRIAQYLMKYIDESEVGNDLKNELQAMIDAYSTQE